MGEKGNCSSLLNACLIQAVRYRSVEVLTFPKPRVYRRSVCNSCQKQVASDSSLQVVNRGPYRLTFSNCLTLHHRSNGNFRSLACHLGDKGEVILIRTFPSTSFALWSPSGQNGRSQTYQSCPSRDVSIGHVAALRSRRTSCGAVSSQ